MLVKVAGELDIETAPVLAVDLDGDVELVILEARQLTFIDSAGLTGIVALHQRLRDQGAVLRLVVTAESMMRRMLRITDLDTIIAVVDKPDANLATAG